MFDNPDPTRQPFPGTGPPCTPPTRNFSPANCQTSGVRCQAPGVRCQASGVRRPWLPICMRNNQITDAQPYCTTVLPPPPTVRVQQRTQPHLAFCTRYPPSVLPSNSVALYDTASCHSCAMPQSNHIRHISIIY